MTLFNIGFYLVIPFLAVHLSENLGLAAWLVGLVLGLRMLSQQGMFFLGGSLADRFGVRPVILVGIAIRVAGFLWLGFAESTASVIISVLMIGFSAAQFAPAVESTNASFGRDLKERGVMRRTELFALEQMCSRLGTVIGPALGAALLAFPFSWTASVAAALFVGMWIGFFALLPRASADERVSTYTLADVWRSVLVNKRFLAFAAMCSCQLLTYSQLYLMLPEQLQRGVGSQDALGWFYVGAALRDTIAALAEESNLGAHFRMLNECVEDERDGERVRQRDGDADDGVQLDQPAVLDDGEVPEGAHRVELVRELVVVVHQQHVRVQQAQRLGRHIEGQRAVLEVVLSWAGGTKPSCVSSWKRAASGLNARREPSGRTVMSTADLPSNCGLSARARVTPASVSATSFAAFSGSPTAAPTRVVTSCQGSTQSVWSAACSTVGAMPLSCS